MSWRDDLHLEGKGSFRKVEFYVDSAESAVGRRTAMHEFPGKDRPLVQDLGRAARDFVLVAYVLGNNYMARRDQLRKAFEQPGSGPLVHPYWGNMTVTIPDKVRIRETTAQGGMARFTLRVVEVGDEALTVRKPDTAAEVDETADLAINALGEVFEDEWTVTGVIEDVRDAAEALIDGVNGVVSVLNSIKGYVNAAMNIVDAIGSAITSLSDTVASLILLPSTLVTTIQDIIADVVAAVDTVTDAWDSYFGDDETAGSTAGTPETAATGATPASGDERAKVLMKAFREMNAYGSGFATVSETTPQRAYQADNQAAMIDLVRGLGVVETCRSASKIPFGSYDQAVSVRDELSDALDALLATAGDISYGPLLDLRAATMTHLTNASADLPRVLDYTPAKTLPALVIAHQLYADSTRDIDIIDRNAIRNPCMVPGGAELEVISDE